MISEQALTPSHSSNRSDKRHTPTYNSPPPPSLLRLPLRALLLVAFIIGLASIVLSSRSLRVLTLTPRSWSGFSAFRAPQLVDDRSFKTTSASPLPNRLSGIPGLESLGNTGGAKMDCPAGLGSDGPAKKKYTAAEEERWNRSVSRCVLYSMPFEA